MAVIIGVLLWGGGCVECSDQWGFWGPVTPALHHSHCSRLQGTGSAKWKLEDLWCWQCGLIIHRGALEYPQRGNIFCKHTITGAWGLHCLIYEKTKATRIFYRYWEHYSFYVQWCAHQHVYKSAVTPPPPLIQLILIPIYCLKPRYIWKIFFHSTQPSFCQCQEDTGPQIATWIRWHHGFS